ncbi:hypothetical protein ACEPAF_906 [Sanghuangporus sanghuang]
MSTSSPIIPKHERSPTPPLTTTLEPRTSGVKLVAPLPIACKISSPNYHKARKQWVWEEIKALNALGLTVTNKFVRDDGLSLEWESPVPVWPDSLKPANFPSPSSSTPQRTTQEDIPMQIEPESMRPISEKEELERQATELEDLAIEFLRKYVRTFDTNRVELSGAYAHNALFSYSVHEHTNVPCNSVAAAFTNLSAAAVHRFAPRKGSRNLRSKSPGNLHSGPSEIVKALQSLGPHKFCARSPTELHWEVLALQLGPTARASSSSSSSPSRSGTSQIAGPFVFLSSHGYLTLVEGKRKGKSTSSEKKLSFDQCFLLQRPHGSKGKGPIGSGETPDSEESGNNQDSNAEWPLVAIDHQLTVRDLSLRPLLLL